MHVCMDALQSDGQDTGSRCPGEPVRNAPLQIQARLIPNHPVTCVLLNEHPSYRSHNRIGANTEEHETAGRTHQ